ncbi:MAG: chromophore lyase CpcT/CpeT [Planctomycetota bacterium]
MKSIPLTCTSTCLALLASCAAGRGPLLDLSPEWVPGAELTALQHGLTGHFSSAGQASRDEDFLHIELRALRIWPERTDGVWLYVEQAAGWALDRPYRQRLYQLTEAGDSGEGELLSRVYLLPVEDPLTLAGAWADASLFDGLSPEGAKPRTGCGIHLHRREDGMFTGRTDGNACPSELGDAVYATSAVLIGPDKVLSWDRGWDAEGRQAWGAEKGPYLFERQAP